MDISKVHIPHYRYGTEPMTGTTVRISERQKANLNRIIDATNTTAITVAIRLLCEWEENEISLGHRQPDDLIITNEPTPVNLGLKVSEADRITLANLKHFYNAQNNSEIIRHLIDLTLMVLEFREGVR